MIGEFELPTNFLKGISRLVHIFPLLRFENASRIRPSSGIVYGCRTHGAYRAYTDEMSSSVLQIAFTITAGMIPIFNMLKRITVGNSFDSFYTQVNFRH